MTEAHRNIQDFLKIVRRKRSWISFAEATTLGGAVVFFGVLLALVLAALWTPAVGRSVIFIAGTLLIGCYWRLWWQPMRAHRSDEAMAHWLEARAEPLHAGVITAVQTAEALREHADRPLPYSRELAEASAEDTAFHLDALDIHSLFETHRLRRFTRWAMVTCLGLWFVILAFPQLASLGALRLVHGVPADAQLSATSYRRVEVAVGEISLRVTPPSYTDLKARAVSQSTGDVDALVGSRVDLTGSALMAAKQVMLVLESDPDGRWPVKLSKQGVLKVTVQVGADDRYRFILVTEEGDAIAETRWRRVRAIVDQIPEVRLLLPKADVEVHDVDSVAILAEAFDDQGLDQLVLVIEGAGRDPIRRLLRRAGGARTLRAGDALSVKTLGLKPGEHVTVSVHAMDQNDVSGPGVGRSATRRISLSSPEREHERLLAAIETLIDGLIELLASRLESPVEGRSSRKLYPYAKAHQVIVGRAALLLNRLHTIHKQTASDPLAGPSFRQRIKAVADKLQEIQSQEMSHLGRIQRHDGVTSRPAVLVTLLFTVNEQGIGETENAIFTLKTLVDENRQGNILDKGRELLELQNGLNDLLSRFEKSGDLGLLREAAQQLNRLETNLRKMEAQLAKLADRVPYENQNPVNRPSETQTEMADLRARLDQARKLLKAGKIAEAKKLLESLYADTQRLMASLQSQFQAARPMTAQAMKATGAFQKTMSEVRDEQQSVFDRTGEARKALEKELKQAFADEIAALLREAEKLRQGLAKIPRPPLHRQDQVQLGEVTGSAAKLKPEISASDFTEAADRATAIAGATAALAKEVKATEEREMNLDRSRRQKAAVKRLQASSKAAEALAKKLRELSKKMERRTAAGKKSVPALKRLGKRQGGLAKRVVKLERALQKLDQQVPGLKRKLGPALEEARQAMERARKQIGKGRPRGARGHQRAALDRLGKVLKRLAKQLKPSDGRAGRAVSGPNDPREKVAIPHGDDAQLPRAFREQLMKAMKERAPKRFRKAIKKFYEELVR